MTPPSALAPGDVLRDGLSVSRKRKRRTDPTKESNKRRRPPRLDIPYFPSSTRHSPGFWDHLKTVFLTRGALKELDRRNASNPKPDPSRTRNKKNSKIAKRCLVTSNQSPGLERFSRTGGPDLTDLRGVSVLVLSQFNGHVLTYNKVFLPALCQHASTTEVCWTSTSERARRLGLWEHSFRWTRKLRCCYELFCLRYWFELSLRP